MSPQIQPAGKQDTRRERLLGAIFIVSPPQMSMSENPWTEIQDCGTTGFNLYTRNYRILKKSSEILFYVYISQISELKLEKYNLLKEELK